MHTVHEMNAEITPADSARVTSDLVELSAEIVSAYVSNNVVSVTDIPRIINSVHEALVGLSTGKSGAVTSELRPAVPVKKSITQDYIICLEDGRQFKSLRRHLKTEYNLTPEEYRVKWGLPPDYPMVAPSYSEARSQLAKTIGLGRKPRAVSGRR